MSQPPPQHAPPGGGAPGWPSAAPGPWGREPHPGAATGPVLVVVGLIILIGVGVLVYFAGHDDEPGEGRAGAVSDELAEDAAPSGGAPPSDAVEVTTTTTSTTTSTVPATPAQAGVHDCVAVTSDGTFVGTGSCADGGTPYRVVEVVEATGDCSNPDNASTPSGDQRLCLEVNLVQNYCYVFPEGGGFITVASSCRAPGTVHVIQVVPGASDGTACTTTYQWNWYYPFDSPQMVACVMKY